MIAFDSYLANDWKTIQPHACMQHVRRTCTVKKNTCVKHNSMVWHALFCYCNSHTNIITILWCGNTFYFLQCDYIICSCSHHSAWHLEWISVQIIHFILNSNRRYSSSRAVLLFVQIPFDDYNGCLWKNWYSPNNKNHFRVFYLNSPDARATIKLQVELSLLEK